MSSDVVKDILSYLEREDVGTYGKLLIRQSAIPSHRGHEYVSCYVTSSPTEPYHMDNTDTVNVVMQVCGGLGETGESKASILAKMVYKKLFMLTDKTINGTLYCGIRATSTPYESIAGDIITYTWNIELTRYLRDVIL